jgi:hypothetical protein
MVIPQDLDAEEAVLGAMLLSAEATAKAAGLIRSGDFYKPAHGHIFAAIENLYRRGEASDAVTVGDELRRLGTFELIGNPGIFTTLQANTPGIPQVTHYAQIVVRHAVARNLAAITGQASDRIAAYADPYELADEIQAQLAAIDMPAVSERQQARTLDEILLESDHMAPWAVPGLVRIDWRVVIVASEGAGKSTLLRQIGVCSAQGVHPFRLTAIEPIRVLIVDLENPAAAIAETGIVLVDHLRRDLGQAYAPENLRILMRPGGMDLRTRHDRTELEREIAIHRPDLLVMGPAYKMLHRRDNRGGTEGHEEATDPVLRILDDLRTRHSFALMIEHHAPQGSGGSRELRPYGSQRWLAWPEMGLTMKPEHEPWKYSIGRFRGDRLKSDWPDELHRSDRMAAPRSGTWPWEGRWSKGFSEGEF